MVRTGHTLYHGTSTLFLDSIRSHGLGAVNPVRQFRLLELLEFLAAGCEREIPNSPDYVQARPSVRRILKQEALHEHQANGKRHVFNFRHGSTYFVSHERGAVFYACRNQYGCEMLSSCVQLLCILRSNHISLSVPSVLNAIDLRTVFEAKQTPVLIEVNNVSLDALNTEHGFPAPSVYRRLCTTIPGLSEPDFVEHQRIFELTKILPYASLRASKIICDKRPEDGSFNYRLEPIHFA